MSGHGMHERREQTTRRETSAPRGKAPPYKPALEPYWRKSAVRNLRGDDGNVGIIRSPVRAIVPPDRVSFLLETTRQIDGAPVTNPPYTA